MVSSSQSPAGGGLPTHAGGKPVVQQPGGAPGGYKAGMPAPSGNPGGNGLAALFMGNQGYGGGGSGVSLPNVTQPTRQSLGLPATLTLPPRTPVQQPAAPAPQAPNAQQIQRRIAQMTPASEVTYGGAMGGGVNPLITGSVGAPAVFAEQYLRMKHQNPAMAQQMLDRAPPQFRSIFNPVQGAAPQQPYQPSPAAMLARSMNERP